MPILGVNLMMQEVQYFFCHSVCFFIDFSKHWHFSAVVVSKQKTEGKFYVG